MTRSIHPEHDLRDSLVCESFVDSVAEGFATERGEFGKQGRRGYLDVERPATEVSHGALIAHLRSELGSQRPFEHGARELLVWTDSSTWPRRSAALLGSGLTDGGLLS